MLELLAPAGSMEALYAAVQNGANAVYLGSGIFNARQGAKNFTPQMLTEAVRYCHVRGVAVHLTLNTLVSDREMADVCALIKSAAASGVDAFIVQDLAVVQLCRQIAPHIPLHGSTQMSIHSLSGVLLCAAMVCPWRAVHVLLRAMLFVLCDRLPFRQPGSLRPALPSALRLWQMGKSLPPQFEGQLPASLCKGTGKYGRGLH